jgi:DNA helicase-2/ATP-dependent DNA helicase PcrA
VTDEILAGLNPKQREAVETVDGPLLIVAGPGSGKTRVVTQRIAYLIRVCGVSPYRIASVTFTNRAAREMRHRLTQLLGPNIRDLSAGTFHSFCAMVLRRDGDAIGLDRNYAIYDSSDQIDLIKRCMKEVDVDPKSFAPRAVLSAISAAKSKLLDVDGFRLAGESYFDEIVLRVYERYEELLSQSSATDFDDLLLKAHFLFDQFPEIAKKYQDRYVHFMIDEFQDTNVVQYSVAKQLSQTHRNLCVVGDPDQSIYSWRNADIRNILSFQTDFPEAKVIALEENYRSTQTILDAATSLIATNTQRVEKELWTRNGKGASIVVREGYNEEEEAQFVIRDIQRLNRGEGDGVTRRYSLGDIAVTYRVNAQSRALEEACLRYGMPYQVVGGLKFYHRQEVKDLAAYLRLVANPDDDVSLDRVVNIPLRGIGQRTVDELKRLARDSGTSMFAAIEALAQSKENGTGASGRFAPRSMQALIGFRELIKGLAGQAESTSEGAPVDLVGLIDLVLDKTGYKRHVLEESERGEERWDNIQEFRNTAGDLVHLGVRDALTEFLERVSLVSDVDSLEEKPDAITLITLHQVKGLEFPVVFIVGMEEGILPHMRSMEDPAALEEERRLCYVGITRAKERLYLMRAFRRRVGYRGGSEPSMASRYLADIPSELILTEREPPARTRATKWASSTPRIEPAMAGVVTRRRAGVVTRRRASEPATPEAATAAFSVGDKVRHAKFGDGIVMSCKPSGTDFEATVAFKEGFGVKRLLLSFAGLEKVG